MLAQEGARIQRYLDVGGMWQRAGHSHQLPLTVFLACNVTCYVNHFVRSTFDIDAPATTGQGAFEPEEKVTIFHRFTIAIGYTLQQL